MKDITIVIPIYKLCEDRKANLNLIIQKFKGLNVKIIIMEQIELGSTSYETAALDVQHVKMFSYKPTFHKTALINESIKYIETTYAWFCDVDFYMEFENITEQDYQGTCFYQPFNYAKDLNRTLTNELHQYKKLTNDILNKTEPSGRIIKHFGALSYITKISAFKDIGMLDINYVGWGYEDLDLLLRVNKSKYNDMFNINPTQIGVHMWHLTSATYSEERQRNYKYYTDKHQTISKVRDIISTNYQKDSISI